MKRFGLLTALVLAIGLLVTSPPSARAAEEPQWRLIERDGDIEIRLYEPIVIAETRVTGRRGAAINQGFLRLANYIFGTNRPQREIAMTAPVAQVRDSDAWVVSFVMPRGSELATMPQPLDEDVTLRAIGERRVAAIRFSGFANDTSLNRERETLVAWLDELGERPLGPPSYAFYDPPWTMPWARRNEIMIELAPQGSES